MASRAELKGRAKSCLKQYYWMAFLVSLVGYLLGAGGSISFNFNRAEHNIYGSGTFSSREFLVFASIFLTIWIIMLVVGILMRVFLSNVVNVGLCSYFLESRKTMTNAGFKQLFSGFGAGNYIKLVKVMFMRDLIVFAWSLLFIIPGIIKSYQYAMVPYILAESPDTDYKSALKWSRDMMRGHKFDFFVLELSFIGWLLLGLLACCIGIVFVLPYSNATYAEFYADIKPNGTSKYYI